MHNQDYKEYQGAKSIFKYKLFHFMKTVSDTGITQGDNSPTKFLIFLKLNAMIFGCLKHLVVIRKILCDYGFSVHSCQGFRKQKYTESS